MPRPAFPSRRVGIILLLAVLFTLSCVHRSTHIGRLSSALNYDDVVYIRCGLDIDTRLHDNGLAGLRDLLTHEGLHSPYSEFLAALALAPFGFHPRAPYYADVVLIVAYLGFLAYFFRKLDLWLFALLSVVFLFLPFATMAVVEFRPDLAWATVLGFNIVYAVTNRTFFERKGPALVFGALLGLALLVKPSTFVMTLLASGLAYGSRLLLEFVREPRPNLAETARRVLVNGGWVLLALLIVAGPYEYYYGRDAWDYFYVNSFGANRAVWVYRGHHPWSFYLTGDGGKCNIGRSGVVILIAALTLLYPRFRRFTLYHKLEVVALAAIFFCIYVVNSAAAMKSPFLGGAMHGTLIYTLAWLLGEGAVPFNNFYRGLNGKQRKLTLRVDDVPPTAAAAGAPRTFSFHGPALLLCFPTIFLVLLVVLSVHLFQFPIYSKVNGENAQLIRKVQSRLDDYFAHAPTPAFILVTQSNPIVVENIEIWYLQHHQRPLVASVALVGSLPQLEDYMAKADLILAQDERYQGFSSTAPVEPFQHILINELRANPHVHLEGTIPDRAGKLIYIFRREAAPVPVPSPAAEKSR